MLTTVQKSDKEIRDQVVAELRWDCRTETSPVVVSVKDGAVTLAGIVKYFAVKRCAEEAAHRIAGVNSVDNQIDVRTQALEFRADCEIADQVRNTLAWNVLVPNEKITEMVEDGFVILRGKVECLTQREEAESALVNILGVRGIVNLIEVTAEPMENETLRSGIERTLERQSGAPDQHVRVDIDKDIVKLTGTVSSWTARRTVVTEAAFAPGVRKVVDDLKVAVSA